MDPDIVFEFGRRWYPYGGGPAEDIMVVFGWAPTRFFTELQVLLRTSHAQVLPAAATTAMLEVCQGRLWLNQ